MTLTTDDELCQCLVTASSDGQIKLYQINHTEVHLSTVKMDEIHTRMVFKSILTRHLNLLTLFNT